MTVKKNERPKEIKEVLFASAFRMGIIKQDDEDFVFIDFGKVASDGVSDEHNVEELTRVAICPDGLKGLLIQVLETGVNYKSDFWEDLFNSEKTLESGDGNDKA